MYLFKQIFQYLNEYYFSVSLGSYDNFEIESVTALVVIIGGLCLGMFLSSVFIILQKKHIGKMARALLSAEASSKETAKTLEELGLSKSPFIKMSLSSPSVLRKLLSIVEGDEVFTYYDELAAAYPNYKEEIEKAKRDEKEEKKDGEKEKEKPHPITQKRFRLRKLDLKTAKFFISPELKERAYFRFKESGNSWWSILVSFLVIAVLFFVTLRFLPVFVEMFDATISNFRNL